MSTLQIALIGLVIALLLAWLWLRRRDTRRSGSSKNATTAPDRIDTITGWPPQATKVLSTQERVAFGTLVRALPEYMVLAQVPLARFINVPKRNSYADWLRRVGYQSVDFLVCDLTAQVVAVVELQPPQQSERAQKRMSRIARTLKAAQVPLHVWRENALPSVDVAREALLPRSAGAPEPVPGPASGKGVAGVATAGAAAPASAPTSAAAAAAAAVTAAPTLSPLNPFDDTGRDSTQDEMIELLEPPPTWFDDLDSDPVPLSKP